MVVMGDAYRASIDHAKRHFAAERRHDVVGGVRRAKVDEAIRGVIDRFAGKYEIEPRNEPNANGSCYFLCLRSAGIRLVCCLVATRKAMVRPSVIRRMWAAHNYSSQRGLFDGWEIAQDQPLKIEHLAVLVHAPVRKRKEELNFVDIVIPDRKFRDYNHRIQLFEMFPKEAESYRALFKRRRSRGEGTGA